MKRALLLTALLLPADHRASGEAAAWKAPSPVEQAEAPAALLPLGIAEGEDGLLCACYAIRTEDSQRYAVYVRWSRDRGVSWQDRRLLGTCRWIETGLGTRPAELVRLAKGLAVVGAFEAEADLRKEKEEAEHFEGEELRKLHFRILRVSPDDVTTEGEAEVDPEKKKEPPVLEAIPSWVLQAGAVSDPAGRDFWGIQARLGESVEEGQVGVAIRPFAVRLDGKGAARFEAIGPWKPVVGAVSCGSVSADAGGKLWAEAFDEAEGAWVSTSAGEPPVRRAEDFLPRFMGSDAAVLRAWRWRGRPDRRLIALRVREQMRSELIERKGGRWAPFGGKWDQPTVPVDCASSVDVMLFATVARPGDAESWALFSVDGAGTVRSEPGLSGLLEVLGAGVGVGGEGRLYALALCRGADGKGHLLACAKRVDPPLLEKLRVDAAAALADLGSTDEKRASAARAAAAALGPAAPGFLRAEREGASGRTRVAIDELIGSLMPAWADPDAYGREGGR